MSASAQREIDPQFDPKFLDVYTGGDNKTRDEILELFLEQADLLLQRLRDARGDAKAWHEVAHSIKGCAAGVGAAGIAEIARVAERGAKEPDAVHALMLRDLEAAVRATAVKVRAVLDGSI